MTRGVRESSSRGYVPLLLTVGGQPLDSLGFPAGVCASEAGVFGDAAHRSHSSRPPSKGFSRPSAWSPASTRCERTAAREDRSSDSKGDSSRRQEKHHRGKRPRVVISSVRAARPKRTRVKNGCRARNERPLQGSRASRAKVSSTEETRAFHEARCASRSWSVANERPRKSARAARSRRLAPEAVRDARRGEDNAPRRPIPDRPKHARRRESPSDLARTPQGDQLQEPHDT